MARRRSGRARAPEIRGPVAQTVQNLRRIFHSIHEASHRVKIRCGLTSPQLWALAEIGRDGGSTVSGLAERMVLDRSVASRLAERLRAKGLIRKRRDDADRRIWRLRITPAGRWTLRRAPSPVQSSLLAGLGRLKPDLLRAVARGTGLLVRHMELQLQGTEAPFFVNR